MQTQRTRLSTTVLILLTALLIPTAHAKTLTKHTKTTPPHTAPTTPSPPRSQSPAWKPDPKFIATLGPEQQFGAFSMRVPTGYQVNKTATPAPNMPTDRYLISGPRRDDMSFPYLLVFIGTAAPTFHAPPAATVLDLNQLPTAPPSIIKSPKQTGVANALPLVRQYFKWPYDPPATNSVHGFQYAYSDGQTYVIIMSLDHEPYHLASLPLLEATALTLRKTP